MVVDKVAAQAAPKIAPDSGSLFLKLGVALVLVLQFAIILLIYIYGPAASSASAGCIAANSTEAKNCAAAATNTREIIRVLGGGASGTGGVTCPSQDGGVIVIMRNSTQIIRVGGDSSQPGGAGAPGAPGSNGENGAPGTAGVNGTNGLPGTSGASGECYTVCTNPQPPENCTPVDRPGESNECVPSGMWCGSHPSAPANSTCCAGFSCQNGYCLPQMPGCNDRGQSCVSTADCCNALPCMGGICGGGATACSTSGPCIVNADCCSRISCVNGMCGSSCHANGTSCITTADCCGAAPCISGVCGMQPACKGMSEICASSTECCSGFSCRGSTCQPVFTEPVCTDSDNGSNFEVAGVTNGTLFGAYGSYADYCRPTGLAPPDNVYNLYEYLCTGNGSEARQIIKGCPYGCLNGVCLSQATPCNDTDGGDNSSVRGTARSVYGNYTDECFDSGSVIENYCVSGYVVNASRVCAYGCSDGACLPAPACAQVGQSCASASCCAGAWCDTAYMTCKSTTPNFCSETDGGLNYLVKGNVTTQIGLFATDYCVNSTSLREYYCNGNYGTFEEVACISVGPSICNNGACGG